MCRISESGRAGQRRGARRGRGGSGNAQQCRGQLVRPPPRKRMRSSPQRFPRCACYTTLAEGCARNSAKVRLRGVVQGFARDNEELRGGMGSQFPRHKSAARLNTPQGQRNCVVYSDRDEGQSQAEPAQARAARASATSLHPLGPASASPSLAILPRPSILVHPSLEGPARAHRAHPSEADGQGQVHNKAN